MVIVRKGFRLLKALLNVLPIPLRLRDQFLLALKSRRWPNFDSPSTFTEKLHYRKYHEVDPRMIWLSDKDKVRDYVSEKIGDEYLIPRLFHGEEISSNQLIAFGSDIVVKRNNDSGSTKIIRDTLDESAAEQLCLSFNKQRTYGAETSEWWYSKIPASIIIEKCLPGPAPGLRPTDYKYHVFRGQGKQPYIFIEVIERCEDGSVVTGAFDRQGQPIYSKSGEKIRYLGSASLERDFPASAKELAEMERVALALSEPFNFVRVDLYLVEGSVYFGEMTFCPSEGRCCFSDPGFDQFLGDQWSGPLLIDPEPQQVSHPALLPS